MVSFRGEGSVFFRQVQPLWLPPQVTPTLVTPLYWTSFPILILNDFLTDIQGHKDYMNLYLVDSFIIIIIIK